MNPYEPLVPINETHDFNSFNFLIDTFRSSITNILDIDFDDIHSDKFKLLKKAYNFSAKVHQGQLRESGEPYLTHLVEVAAIIAGLRMDCASIIAALLHDTVEDTNATIDEIKEEFGDEIAFMVEGLTKISKLSFKSSEEVQAENTRKMIVAMAKDIRVIIIKIADRLHNLRTLNFLPEERRIKISQETLDIYAPLANRLGIFSMKSELEDLSLKYLNPEIYKELSLKVNKKRVEREEFINKVSVILKENLEKHNLEAEIYGRPKHFYSIYKKIIEQHISFEEIYDLIALRIIVNSVNECYEVLGIVHSLWKPISGRIKDYIAMPKANFYRSLHTTVIGPDGMRIEIQIRTKDMHFIDEFGIAAHWQYKESITDTISKEDLKQFNWLRQLVEYQKELKDPHEFLDSVKIDLFQDEVYVFTPKGDVIALPKDSTPIDFAYYVHTEVGNKAAGAIVNGNLLPLKYKLHNGDIVEILTKEDHHPSKDWLKLAKSSKALSKIRSWVKEEERDESVVSGKESLEREFKKLNIKNINIDLNDIVNLAIKHFSFKNTEELFASIGYGKYSPSYIFSSVIPDFKKSDKLSSITKKNRRCNTKNFTKDQNSICFN
jgi:GTP pyrophosphokinase